MLHTRLKKWPWVYLLILAGAGCTHFLDHKPETIMTIEIQDHRWYTQDHHGRGGDFRNIWGNPRIVSPLKAARWIIRHSTQNKDNIPAPAKPVDQDILHSRPDRLRITWLGHSATLIQTREVTLITDPMLGERASPFSFMGPDRKAELPIKAEDLPAIDIVLVSHDHYDHLDEGSIRTIQHNHAPLFLVPLGIGEIIRDWGGTRVLELDWWQFVKIDGLRIHCTPAKHFSGRGLTGRNETLWVSWYIEEIGTSLCVYFGGDSGYASHFSEIRSRLGAPEIALLPIGAYLPRWFMGPVHVDPTEAVQAFRDLEATYFIPMHWGTFDLADEPLHEPARQVRLAADDAGIMDRLQMLVIGESFSRDGMETGDPKEEDPPPVQSN